MATHNKHTVFLVQYSLVIGLDSRGKVVVENSYNIRLHGAIGWGLFDSVFEYVASSNDGSNLKTLLQATMWTTTGKGRALTMSIAYRNKHLVQDLFDAKAGLNKEIACYSSATPLLLAVRDQDISLIRRLIKAGADLEPPEFVTFAVSTGNKQILKTLLEAEANVNHPRRGRTDPFFVTDQGYAASLAIPLKAGADVNNPTSPDGRLTALQLDSVLQLATEEGSIELVDILLKAGANVNQPLSFDSRPPVLPLETVLQLAAEKGSIGPVDLLLKAGANINHPASPCHGRTALQLAAIRGHIGIARRLLESGADINAAKSLSYERTALEGAAEYGRIDTLQLLLSKGASIQGPGRCQYIRAVKLAEKNLQYAATKLLRDHGGLE